MPPRKKKSGGGDEGSGRKILGRPGNNLKIGIVGLPNVGKSTLFNTLTKLHVPAENYAFCTLDPNVARVPVPDKRFQWLVEHWSPRSAVEAVVTVTDIAGLVRGASEGEGLGNAFLSHIRAVDAIFHVCRAFKNSDIAHVEESVDPVRDLEIIHNELLLKDVETVAKAMEGMAKQVERGIGGKEVAREFEVLQKLQAHLDEGKDVRNGEWSGLEIDYLNKYQLLTAKPMIYLVNVSERDYIRKRNKFLMPLKEYIDGRGCGEPMIPFSAEFEMNLLDQGGEEEAAAYCEEKGAKTILPKILHTGYRFLNLIHFFTAGEDEVKCWTIQRGCRAPQAAGVIHTDFEKGFIKAECMSFADYKELGSESAVKGAGKLKLKGKDYVVEDGDIIHFRFNT